MRNIVGSDPICKDLSFPKSGCIVLAELQCPNSSVQSLPAGQDPASLETQQIIRAVPRTLFLLNKD